MRSMQFVMAALCALVASPMLMLAQLTQDQTPKIEEPTTGLAGLRKYKPQVVPPADLSNSGRLESLLRAGNIYLSLQDAIALAIENNIDIASARYGPAEAEQDLRRAKAGGALRGVNTTVATGST